MVLKELDCCIDTKTLGAPAGKEVSWLKYENLKNNTAMKLNKYVQDKQLSYFATLACFEYLVSINHVCNDDDEKDVDLTLDSFDCDVCEYIGGFVLFQGQVYCKKSPKLYSQHLALIQSYKAKEVSSACKLISAKNRGGLIQPKPSIILFFKGVELCFRKTVVQLSAVTNQTFIDFVKCVVNNESLMKLVLNSSKDFETSVQVDVYKLMLKSYYQVRVHGKCRQYMQKKLYTDKKVKKSNAFRKTLF